MVPFCTASSTCRPGTISPAAKTRIWNLLSVISPMYLAKISPAPYSVSSDLGKLDARRHLSSGIDWAMAGAASVLATATAPPPTPAVRRNLRRCMCFTPRNVFLFAKIPLSGISLPRGTALGKGAVRQRANKKSPAEAGLFPAGPVCWLEPVGGRLARHEVVEGVLGHAEPQDFLVPERLPGIEDLLELRVLGCGLGVELVGGVEAGLHHRLRERQELGAGRDQLAQRPGVLGVVLGDRPAHGVAGGSGDRLLVHRGQSFEGLVADIERQRR